MIMTHATLTYWPPLDLGFTTLPNRVLMGSMHRASKTGTSISRRWRPTFCRRARGGVGLIVTAGFAPNIEVWAKPFAGHARHVGRPHGDTAS